MYEHVFAVIGCALIPRFSLTIAAGGRRELLGRPASPPWRLRFGPAADGGRRAGPRSRAASSSSPRGPVGSSSPRSRSVSCETDSYNCLPASERERAVIPAQPGWLCLRGRQGL